MLLNQVSGRVRNRRVDRLLGLRENQPQMIGTLKALGIDLVDILGAGGTRRKPSVRSDDLCASDRRVVTGRPIVDALNRFAPQLTDMQLLCR